MIAKRLRSLLVFALLTLSLAPTVLAHAGSPPTYTSVAGQPDFSLNAFPGNTLTIPANGDRYLEDVDINSIYGFSGSVAMFATSSSTVLYAQLGLEVAKVAPGSGVYFNITFSSVTVGAYSVNVTGTSGSLVHSFMFQIFVMTPSVGDFALTAGQQSLSMLPGNSTTVSVSITSLDNFSGLVYVNAFVYASDTYTLNDPFALQATLNTNQFSMLKNQTIVDTLTLETPNLPIHGIYTVTITGKSGSLSHSTAVTMAVTGSTPKPQTGGFTLFGLSSIESYGIVAGLIALLGLSGLGIYSWRKTISAPKT